MRFTGHVHTHTEYSALDGLSKIQELVTRAKELGQTFIAITDHGSSSGLYEASLLAEKENFDILLGEEFYFENDCQELKTGHLILIAKNEIGLENLFQLQKLAWNNVYYKPRVNYSMLEQFHEGLICTSACIANAVGQYILKNENHLALNELIRLQKIFGDDFYVELQANSTNEDVIKVNKVLSDFCLSGEWNFKSILTTDIHYCNKEDSEVHEVLLAIQQGKKMSDPKRWKFNDNEYWLKSEEEMIEGASNSIPLELINKCFLFIDEIHEKCNGHMRLKSGNFLPQYECDNVDDELERMVYDRYAELPTTEKNVQFVQELQHELSVIKETGYSGYFLIVQEYVNWAKKNSVLVGDGRGSGAASRVAYTLGITAINPQPYNLLFERFLSPGRVPDIDSDFSNIDAVFKHLQRRYGKDNVARVGAISRFTCKSALRKVMSAYSFSMTQTNEVVKWLPNDLEFTLEDAMNYSTQFKDWLNNNQNIYKAVAKLEGIMDHMSTHAGGVIIYPNLTKMLPVYTQSEDRDKLIVGLDKHAIEELGHYKFDILGLNSLNLLEDIYINIGQKNRLELNLEVPDIYNSLQKGDVLGVFQLSNQKDKVMEQQPKCFADLIAINALVRPGVGDWGEYIEKRNGTLPETTPEELLETSGIIVYQDQYLLLAQRYAGWDIAFGDKNIRKNKNLRNDLTLKEKFMEDGYQLGYKEEILESVWQSIVDVAAEGYGFNKAHATSYAKLTYETAYLKHYYPTEFYAAYLTNNIGDTVKLQEAFAECKQKDIELIPPDINTSTDKFIPYGENKIMMPLNSIQGVGGSAIYEINRLKPIKDLDDFLERRIKKFVKKTVISALILGGAFDFTGVERNTMLDTFEPDTTHDYSLQQCEKMAYGFYVTASPFDKYSIKSVSSIPEGTVGFTIAEINKINLRNDKNGNEMAFVDASNNIESIRLVCFSYLWKTQKCEEGKIYMIHGKKDKQSLLVTNFEEINE